MEPDPKVLAYFRGLLITKHGKLTESDLDSKAGIIYRQFEKFLLQEFKTKVKITATENEELRHINSHDNYDLLKFLDKLSKSNVGQNLDTLLIEILQSFVQQNYQKF